MSFQMMGVIILVILVLLGLSLARAGGVVNFRCIKSDQADLLAPIPDRVAIHDAGCAFGSRAQGKNRLLFIPRGCLHSRLGCSAWLSGQDNPDKGGKRQPEKPGPKAQMQPLGWF